MSMELGGLQSLETIIQIGNMSEITNIEDAIKSKIGANKKVSNFIYRKISFVYYFLDDFN